MSNAVFINGKFYSAQMTGVHRVAEELLQAMDRILKAEPALQIPAMQILLPSNTRARPAFETIAAQKPGRSPWVPWEQLELPWRARQGILLNLCNLGPLASRGCVTMIHDAQVYISPDSYSPAFVAWYKFALPILGRQAAAILTVSEYSKAMLARHKVAPPEKIHVIHNGVDHILRTPPEPDAARKFGLDDKKYVLALSNTQAHKNIPLLMSAFENLTSNDLKLVLLGAATKADFEAVGAKVPDNVIFAGRVSDAQMRGLMEQALCFACPSLTEGFGLPPLEAMLTGCPAIIAPCGALPEVCGAAAMIADPYQPSDWAKSIQALVENTSLRTSLIEAGRAQASKFKWETSARLLLDVIKKQADA